MENGAYPLTTAILGDIRLKARFCRIDVHEEQGQADRLWLEYTPDDAMSEGEYIAIDQDQAYCEVYHDLAHNVGGAPTVWRFSGSEGEALSALVDYLPSTEFAG